MLRASSLGLSHISPTIRVIRPCPLFHRSGVWPPHIHSNSCTSMLRISSSPQPKLRPSGDVVISDDDGHSRATSQSPAGAVPAARYQESIVRLPDNTSLSMQRLDPPQHLVGALRPSFGTQTWSPASQSTPHSSVQVNTDPLPLVLEAEPSHIQTTTPGDETYSSSQLHRAAEELQYGRPWYLESIPPLRRPYTEVSELAERLTLHGETINDRRSSCAASKRGVVPTRPLDPITLRMKLLYDLSQTSSAPDAWDAYSNLVKLEEHVKLAKQYSPFIPFNHLHRLSRLLMRSRPKTRALFRKLLTVLSDIQARGGVIQRYEWNSLIHHAGKGIRSTTLEDFERSLSIFRDMVEGRQPGRELSEAASLDGRYTSATPVEPDIYTYTTLINIAARTLDKRALAQVSSQLKQSGLQPTRITFLSMLRYYSHKKLLAGIRSTLLTMRDHDFDLGIDGLNACIWAYGRNNQDRIAMMIYRLLRHNAAPEKTRNVDGIKDIARRLEEEESINVPSHLIPNEVTYTVVIQIMAHYGNFVPCLTAFTDMLSSENVEEGAPLLPDDNGELKPTAYSPNIAIYRAIFLGFSRHAVTPPSYNNPSTPSDSTWNLRNLTTMFDSLIAWPEDVDPGADTVYWIMLAFDKASGRDIPLLRKVWLQLERRFNGPWGGENHRLRRIRKALFPERKK